MDDHSSLEHTPTWAVAAVCTVFVLLSLLLERGIHNCGKRLKLKNQKPLSEALEKMKEELMLMGFISLLLSVFQPLVSELCVPRSYFEHMLPCRYEGPSAEKSHDQHDAAAEVIHGRKLLLGWLRDRGDGEKCTLQGKVPMISSEGLHQLHIFIFAMAIVHLCYSCLTMLLGRIKVYWWRCWEEEVRRAGFSKRKESLEGNTMRSRQQSFIRIHARRPWSTHNLLNWFEAFGRHLFCKPVAKPDYLALRAGFIKNYNLREQFDFHGYITRVLENDFKVVVGISAHLWAFVVLFLLLNIHGWHTYFWMAFLPLILILVVGTKLQYIITELACEIADLQDKTGEEAIVRPRDDLFWFHRPRFLLYLIHFTLFQNAFELAFFFWVGATFGFDTCFMDSVAFITIRLFVGLAVQFLCSYSTLPLYVLVTQMGSHYNSAIFTRQIQKGIKGWQQSARSKKKQRLSEEYIQAGEKKATSRPKHHRVALRELMDHGSPMNVANVPSPVHRILEMELPGCAAVESGNIAVIEVVHNEGSDSDPF